MLLRRQQQLSRTTSFLKVPSSSSSSLTLSNPSNLSHAKLYYSSGQISHSSRILINPLTIGIHNKLYLSPRVSLSTASNTGQSSTASSSSSVSNTVSISEENDITSLKENRQLVGRILGDVVRDNRGTEAFERIENIRRLCVAFRKAGPNSNEAQEIKKQLKILFAVDIDVRINIIRAFSLFSYLVNIAEDVDIVHGRRELQQIGRQSRRGSLQRAITKVESLGNTPQDIEKWLQDAIISPVLTAHPTEVKRKSIMDCEREIFRLLETR